MISEACFLLSRVPDGANAVLQLLANDVLQVDFRLRAEVNSLHKLMQKFASVPMSLTDACLVRMTELDSSSKVMTLDSDFRICRRGRRHLVPTIMPAFR